MWWYCLGKLLRGKPEKILQLQKHAARMILDIDIKTNSTSLFKQAHWLSFHEKLKVKLNKCVSAYTL